MVMVQRKTYIEDCTVTVYAGGDLSASNELRGWKSEGGGE
jgi:hypothetical protein